MRAMVLTYNVPGVQAFFFELVIPFVLVLTVIWVGWLLRRRHRGQKSGNEEL